MIRKTTLMCMGAVLTAVVSVGLMSACSGGSAVSSQNHFLSLKDGKTNSGEGIDRWISSQYALDFDGLKSFNEEYSNNVGSVWDSSLIDESRFKINVKLTNAEEKWAKANARSLATHLERGSHFVHYLLVKLKEYDLPVELMAIPIIESGLNPHVRSTAGAHGPWQFMRSTGKSLGLERSSNYDELYDFVATTDASLKYLKYLYEELEHNWDMVAAAYNQGEFGVKKAIRQAKARGVTKFNVNTVKLTSSARTYIKRFHAYSAMLRDPERFNLRLPDIKNRPAFQKVEVAGRLNSMKKAAELSGTNLSTLKKLNAGFLSDNLNTRDGHALLVPSEKAYALESALRNKQNKVAVN